MEKRKKIKAKVKKLSKTMIKCKKFVFEPQDNQIVNFCFRFGKRFEDEIVVTKENEVSCSYDEIIHEIIEDVSIKSVEIEETKSESVLSINDAKEKLLIESSQESNRNEEEYTHSKLLITSIPVNKDDNEKNKYEKEVSIDRLQSQTPVSVPTPIDSTPESPKEVKMMRALVISHDHEILKAGDNFCKQYLKDHAFILDQNQNAESLTIKIMKEREIFGQVFPKTPSGQNNYLRYCTLKLEQHLNQFIETRTRYTTEIRARHEQDQKMLMAEFETENRARIHRQNEQIMQFENMQRVYEEEMLRLQNLVQEIRGVEQQILGNFNQHQNNQNQPNLPSESGYQQEQNLQEHQLQRMQQQAQYEQQIQQEHQQILQQQQELQQHLRYEQQLQQPQQQPLQQEQQLQLQQQQEQQLQQQKQLQQQQQQQLQLQQYEQQKQHEQQKQQQIQQLNFKIQEHIITTQSQQQPHANHQVQTAFQQHPVGQAYQVSHQQRQQDQEPVLQLQQMQMSQLQQQGQEYFNQPQDLFNRSQYDQELFNQSMLAQHERQIFQQSLMQQEVSKQQSEFGMDISKLSEQTNLDVMSDGPHEHQPQQSNDLMTACVQFLENEKDKDAEKERQHRIISEQLLQQQKQQEEVEKHRAMSIQRQRSGVQNYNGISPPISQTSSSMEMEINGVKAKKVDPFAELYKRNIPNIFANPIPKIGATNSPIIFADNNPFANMDMSAFVTNDPSKKTPVSERNLRDSTRKNDGARYAGNGTGVNSVPKGDNKQDQPKSIDLSMFRSH